MFIKQLKFEITKNIDNAFSLLSKLNMLIHKITTINGYSADLMLHWNIPRKSCFLFTSTNTDVTVTCSSGQHVVILCKRKLVPSFKSREGKQPSQCIQKANAEIVLFIYSIQ